MRVVLATANPDKAREIRELFADVAGLELWDRPPSLTDVEETETTLEGNAALKAAFVAAATGEAAVADDTGLFVDALDGAPGVYSARYAGPGATYADNVHKLLDALRDVPEPRLARFETCAVLIDQHGRRTVTLGVVHGTIATAPRGTAGFGYDPVFVPDGGDGRTMGELSEHEKHAVSHRGRAFRALTVHLGDPS
jgi:XTP/dITP diphosphohydrolase